MAPLAIGRASVRRRKPAVAADGDPARAVRWLSALPVADAALLDYARAHRPLRVRAEAAE